MTFREALAEEGPFELPCGGCIGCRLKKSREWAIRCYHEAQMHDDNSYVTFTYDDDHLPLAGSLRHRDWQLFMKRFRKKRGHTRFFMCGEYGEKRWRPHFHAILFGQDFADKCFYKYNKQGDPLFTSATLDSIWQQGACYLGAATFTSAAYVARYIMKKQTGKNAESHYRLAEPVICPETGEVIEALKPEYCRSSQTGPLKGLGYTWLRKFKRDVFPCDFVVVEGRKFPIPRYYEKVLTEEDPEIMDEIKHLRYLRSVEDRENQTPERLAVREQVKKAQTSQLRRDEE